MQKEEVRAEHVRDALWQGADDEDDVLPYAREHNLVVVTSSWPRGRHKLVVVTSSWSSQAT
ncbi:hypothetical protein [Haladaptatus sp. NG-WS-4]